MFRLSHKILCAGLGLAASAWSSFGFSLAGPLISEPYQVIEIAYQLLGDIVTPKNLGEEYRRTTPVVYYYFDANFRDYFGSNVVAEVEKAIAIFNNLSNVSDYSATMTEVPNQSLRENYRAEALALEDVKSYTLGLLCEQMGLAE